MRYRHWCFDGVASKTADSRACSLSPAGVVDEPCDLVIWCMKLHGSHSARLAERDGYIAGQAPRLNTGAPFGAAREHIRPPALVLDLGIRLALDDLFDFEFC